MINSRKGLVAIVLAMLLITAMPVAAEPWQGESNTTTGSSHTSFGTDGEEPEPTVTNGSIIGNGDDASVVLGLSESTVSRDPDDGTRSRSEKHGLVINPNSNLKKIKVESSRNTEGLSRAQIYNSSDVLLAEGDISSGTVELNVELKKGNDYYLVGDANGNTYTVGERYYFGGYPDTSTHIDIVNGSDGVGSIESNYAFNFNNITATESNPPESGQYISATHQVENPSEGYININQNNSSATIEWQANDGGSWTTVTTDTTTASGEHTAALSDYSYTEWRVNVTLEKQTGVETWDASINEDGVRFQNTAPTISNPSPEDGSFYDNSTSVDLQVDVSDPEFGTAQGESVDVTFYDASGDSVIGTDTLPSNGTASTTWSSLEMGTNSWYAVAEDDYGGSTQTDTLSFDTPSELRIYNETDPSQLVNDSVEAEVTFFGDDQTYTRTTTDGTIDLSGLPQQEFTVQVEASGYITRQTIIRSITEQQEVFLLPETAETVNSRFELEDPTGQFDQDSSRILIKKPIERDGTTTYKTVVGDVFGTGEFSTILERDQRYLIEVENTRTGELRELGPYVATASENVILEVDQINYEFEDEEIGYAWNASYVNGSEAIDFAFDADHGFESLEVEITERGSGTVIYSETWTNGDSVQDRIVVPDSIENANATSYSVEWSATVTDGDGNTVSVNGSKVVGPNPENPIEGVPPRVLELVAIFLILVIAGLFSAANVGIGGVVTSLSAGLFWAIDILPGAVSGMMIALALLVSVLWMVRNARGPQ